jgi:exopolyphosphatase/pppGpp-phosphohydrolase
VLDLGGGRLQLTSVAGRQAQRSSSWPLGAVRVTEQHLASSRAVSRKQLKAARAAVRGQLGDVNLILQSGLPGYGPREVARIAEVVRHHRKGSPDDGLVARCALLLRLAEQLDRGQDQAVIEARLVAERRALRLRLRGDDRLARWSLERRLSDGAFRRVFGRRLVVTR